MRPDLCAEQGHPGVTYNPWVDRTWCLCGEVTMVGDLHTHSACCGGPLIEYLSKSDRVYWAEHRHLFEPRERLSEPDKSTFEVPAVEAGDLVLF